MISAIALVTVNLAQGGNLSELRRQEIAAMIPAFELANEGQAIQAALTGPVTRPRNEYGYDQFYVSGLTVAFFKGTDDIAFCLGAANFSSFPQSNLTDASFKNKALAALEALSPIQYDSLKLTVTRAVSGEDSPSLGVDVTPILAGRTCDNGALFTYDQRSGKLAAVRVDRRLDHSRYRNSPTISQSEALNSAIDAYSRWRPFTNGLVKYGPLLRSGVQNPGSGGEFALEAPASIQEEWRTRKARPYWLVQFAKSPGSSSHQRVCVDAITGRAQVIDSFITMGSKPLKIQPLMATEVLQVPTCKGEVARAAATNQSGIDVPVRRGMEVFIARFDKKRQLLFLPQGGKWFAFKVKKGLGAALQSTTTKAARLGTFGAKKN